MSRPWQALRALRLRLLGPAKELVGTDQFGNKYYRVPKHETRADRGPVWVPSRNMKPVLPHHGSSSEQENGDPDSGDALPSGNDSPQD